MKLKQLKGTPLHLFILAETLGFSNQPPKAFSHYPIHILYFSCFYSLQSWISKYRSLYLFNQTTSFFDFD